MLKVAQGFTGVDPLADKMPGWSPYNYTLGNPISLVDPDGRMPQDCCGGGPTIADEIVPGLIAAAMQLKHSISRNYQIVVNGAKPESIPYRNYTTEWDGERSVVTYTESSVEPSAGSRILDNTLAGADLAGAIPTSGGVLAAKASGGNIFTRIGRWMSGNELAKMEETGKVQPGAGGATFGSTGGADDFRKQAPKGSVYVEYDVPSKSVLPGGKESWVKTISKNANAAMRWALGKQGGTIDPPATNIKKIEEKK